MQIRTKTRCRMTPKRQKPGTKPNQEIHTAYRRGRGPFYLSVFYHISSMTVLDHVSCCLTVHLFSFLISLHVSLAGDLPQHLQVMFKILRSEDRIKLVGIKLAHPLLFWISVYCSFMYFFVFLAISPSVHRLYGWRADGQTGCATWSLSTPTDIKIQRKTSSWEWTLQTRTGN